MLQFNVRITILDADNRETDFPCTEDQVKHIEKYVAEMINGNVILVRDTDDTIRGVMTSVSNIRVVQ